MFERLWPVAGFVLALVYSGCSPAPAPVRLRVLLPDDAENAQVTVDGTETKQEGTVRYFVSPPISAGRQYTYNLEARWDPNGYTTIYRPRKVTVRAGEQVDVDMRREDPSQKDKVKVIYVPTPEVVVDAMLEMAKVGKDDVVYDLGCGDGRLVVNAVKKFGAKRGVGLDIDPERIKDSNENAAKAGVSDRVNFRKGDVLDIKDLSDASVVTLYVGEVLNMALRPILQKTLKPGSRVVSHRFDMGDWKPLQSKKVFDERGVEYELHLWVIEDAAKQAGKEADDKEAIRLKVLLPDERAKLNVDGKDIGGTGTERRVVLPGAPADKKVTITVTAQWDPNGYTTIYRVWKVTARGGQSLEVDMRKEDPAQKDKVKVIYVPTPTEVVDAMLKMAKVGKDDVVYDLGCGDGRLVVDAVKKFGAKRGVGFDIDPERIKDSNENAKKAGVTDKVDFRREDVLNIKDLSDATVVTLYVGEVLNLRLKPILQKTLKPGSRVVSHRFDMGPDWKPLETKEVTDEFGTRYTLHLWVIGKDK
jgi:uncharacterized protein (TIGR03000 family)